jgi:hypothetical protein
LVVSNAPVADASLSHDGVETGISDGVSATAAGWFRAADECVDAGVAAVLLLDFPVASTTQHKEDSGNDGTNDDNGDNNTGGNTGCVRTT